VDQRASLEIMSKIESSYYYQESNPSLQLDTFSLHVCCTMCQQEQSLFCIRSETDFQKFVAM
jgi:hypothetical protein